jgi:hypothetical protein
MKFFAKPLLSWKVPTLFAARTRDRRGWVLRSLLVLLIFGVMMLGFYADRNWGGRGPKFSPAGALLLAAFIGVFFAALLEAPDLNRQATISDDAISSFGNAGMHSTLDSWALRKILWVWLYPPTELGRSFGAMEIRTQRGGGRIGVPATLEMRRIAEVLHGQGVRVILPGWEPAAARPGSESEPESPVAAAMFPGTAIPAASARIERLGDDEAGQIVTPGRYRLCLALALGPLLVSVLTALVLLGYVLYRNRIQRAPATATDVAAGLGGVTLLIGGFWFTGRFGNLAPSLYLRSVARSVIELRPKALFNPRDEQAVYIDVVPRKNWGKVMVREFSDTGLLKVDEGSRCVLFEGDQERWRIPTTSLVSVDVESYRPAGHVEGTEPGEWMHATVIKARVADTIWEAPIRKCHVEWQPKNNQLREANALALRDAIRALRPGSLR